MDNYKWKMENDSSVEFRDERVKPAAKLPSSTHSVEQNALCPKHGIFHFPFTQRSPPRHCERNNDTTNLTPLRVPCNDKFAPKSMDFFHLFSRFSQGTA
jgi:hypothetical protein